MIVLFTPKAKETLKLVWDFLIENWGEKSANKFLEKTEEIIDLIAN